MAIPQWFTGWHPRYARVLAEVDTDDVRAALVDTNGDGRELCFSLELRTASGEWEPTVDWDDVWNSHELELLDHVSVLIGWGRSPYRHVVVEHGGRTFRVTVGATGWWLLATTVPDGDTTVPDGDTI